MKTKGINFKTITTDNGTKFTQHKKITGVIFYFTDHYCLYQKWLVEHINGQIRVFFPNGTDFREISDSHVAVVENIFNNQ